MSNEAPVIVILKKPQPPHVLLSSARPSLLEAANTHNTHLGPSFLQYYENQKILLPICEVKYKIYNIRHLNDVDGTIDIDFVIMVDWEDPSLSLLDKNASQKTNIDEYNPADFFWPRFELLNVETNHGDNNTEIGMTLPKRKGSKAHPYRVSITHHCIYTFHIALDFRAFPNDEQVIGLSVKSRTAQRLSEDDEYGEIQFAHPIFRNGHEITPTADSLLEWDISSMRAAIDPPANQPGRKDSYTMQILIERDAKPIFWKAVFPCACIDLLSLTAFGSPMTHLKDREGTVITLFLTVMAFKYVLNQKLPSVPYLTSIEKYVTVTFMALLIEGLIFFVLHELAMHATGDAAYRSDQFPEARPTQVNWFTGLPPKKNSTPTTTGATNQQLHVLDKCALVAFVVVFILKNLWYFNLGCGTSTCTLNQNDNFLVT